jgi:hypothetical protein
MASSLDENFDEIRLHAASIAAQVILTDPFQAHSFMATLIDQIAARTGKGRLTARERLHRALLIDARADAAHAIQAGLDRSAFMSMLSPELRTALQRYLRVLDERQRTARGDIRPEQVRPKFPPGK